MPELAFISLGSNIDPEVNLPAAVRRLGSLGSVVRVSSAYRNPAVGPARQPQFVNAAALVLTSLTPVEIRAELRRIEAELGRLRRPDPYAPRTIDLDLCYLGEHAEELDGWSLPDAEADQLAYLAIPLAELEPAFRHPTTGETLESIAEQLRPEAQLTLEPSITLAPSAGPATPT